MSVSVFFSSFNPTDLIPMPKIGGVIGIQLVELHVLPVEGAKLIFFRIRHGFAGGISATGSDAVE